MGGGGGSSSSSSSSSSNTTHNNTSTWNTDRRQVVDGGSVGVSSDSSTVNVNMTDSGAVRDAMLLMDIGAQRNADSLASNFAELMRGSRSNYDAAANTLGDGINKVASVLDQGYRYNVQATADNYDKTLDSMNAGNKRINDSFDNVIGLADNLLSGALDTIKNSTDAVKNTNDVISQAYETARTTANGSIDQKTIIVLAVAGAAAFVMSRRH